MFEYGHMGGNLAYLLPVSLVKSTQVFEPNRTFQEGLVDLDGDGDLDAVLPISFHKRYPSAGVYE